MIVIVDSFVLGVGPPILKIDERQPEKDHLEFLGREHLQVPSWNNAEETLHEGLEVAVYGNGGPVANSLPSYNIIHTPIRCTLPCFGW